MRSARVSMRDGGRHPGTLPELDGEAACGKFADSNQPRVLVLQDHRESGQSSSQSEPVPVPVILGEHPSLDRTTLVDGGI